MSLHSLGDKIASFTGLGPVLFAGNTYSPIFTLLAKFKIVELLVNLKIYNLFLFPAPVSIIL
jgi:hypothetical protein